MPKWAAILLGAYLGLRVAWNLWESRRASREAWGEISKRRPR